MLVLTRMGKKVKIENFAKREIWTAKLINSKRYDSQLLCVDVEKHMFATPPTSDLTFDISPIDCDEWTDVVKSNLHLREEYPEHLSCAVGKILLAEAEAGNVYVNGLFVSTTSAKFGYDFKPEAIKLDRDRGMVRDFELFWSTSRMWLGKTDRPEFIDMLTSESDDEVPDVQYCGSNVWDGHEATAVAYAAFTDKHGLDAYPVSSESEIADIKKMFPKAKTVYVTSNHRDVLKHSDGLKQRKEKLSEVPLPQPPEKLLAKHRLKFKSKMGLAELTSFDRLLTRSVFWEDTRSK